MEDRVPIERLDDYATEKWEVSFLGLRSSDVGAYLLLQTMLHFLVGSELQRKPSASVLSLLERSGLMIVT